MTEFDAAAYRKALVDELTVVFKELLSRNNRLDIASQQLPFISTDQSGLGPPAERRAREALVQADALIQLEAETRASRACPSPADLAEQAQWVDLRRESAGPLERRADDTEPPASSDDVWARS